MPVQIKMAMGAGIFGHCILTHSVAPACALSPNAPGGLKWGQGFVIFVSILF